jgi:transglutaminase-like putative cysteine protease
VIPTADRMAFPEIVMVRIGIALALVMGPMVALAQLGPRFDLLTEFDLRHEALRNDPDFKSWIGDRPIGNWRESQNDTDGTHVVIVQVAGDMSSAPLFAAKMRLLEGVPTVLYTADFTATQVSTQYRKLFAAFGKVERVEKPRARPVVTFRSPPVIVRTQRSAAADLLWEFVPYAACVEGPRDAALCTSGDDDDLSSNDLHHPDDACISAIAWRAAPAHADIDEVAATLCALVYEFVKGDIYDQQTVYTDSDLLILTRKTGVCDERAVLLVSYLRARRIPARIKVLRWIRKGLSEQHAVVEYRSHGVVGYLDPTSNMIGRPEWYRKEPDRNGFYREKVTVMDVDWPSDSRSTEDIGPFPDDSTTDGRLNPAGDFCVKPSTCGEERPGYSHD